MKRTGLYTTCALVFLIAGMVTPTLVDKTAQAGDHKGIENLGRMTAGVACEEGLSGAAQWTRARAVSFRDLLRMRRPINVEISPNGRRVAVVVRRGDLNADVLRTSLWMIDVTRGKPRRLLAKESDVRVVHWSPNGDRLAVVVGNAAGSQIEVIDTSGRLLRTISGAGDIGEFSWAPDGSRLVFTSPAEDPELPQLWTVYLATGLIGRLVDDNAALSDPQWSPDGRLIAYVRFPADMPDGQFFPTIDLVDVFTGKFQTVTDPAAEYVSSPRWSPDGTRLAYLAHPAHDDQWRALAFNRIHVLSIAGGAPVVLASSFKYAPLRPAWSGDGRTIFFEAFTGETGQLFSVPSSGGDAVAITDVTGVAYIASYARNDSSMALVIEDPQTPPEIHVSPFPPHFRPRRITSFNRALQRVSTGKSRVVRWTSADGLEVSGVLLLPPNFRTGKPVPTLVVSHGGPATLVVLSYPDSWLLSGAAAWVSDGWAVFFPNYRGSTNKDQAFAFAEIGEFGRGDFDDVMTGVDTLIRMGIADPDRLAHSGWSFGGYLSGWANTHTSRFKAIVAGAGPYDWTTTYPGSTDQFVLRIYLQGTPDSNPQRYQEASVSTWVDRALTPILLFGAEADDLVPASESERFFDALQARGVGSELRIFPNEPHELQRPSNQLEKLELEREWIIRYIPPAPAHPKACF